MKNSLKFAFLEFVNRHQLIEPGQRILIAVSGGIDSMALLHLLQNWQQYFKLQIGVAHFNHQLRGEESGRDEQFVKAACQRAGIPFFSGRGDVKKYALNNKYSTEEAARLLREEFLENCREEGNFDVIATGHNLNDQAETLLMRLFAGTGPEGLAGIRLRREGYIRPLLFAERAAIEEYAAAHQIAYREDRTNRDLRFVRNKIRHQLLPYLQQEFQLTRLDSFLNLGLIIQEWLPTVYEQAEAAFRESVTIESQNKIRLDITAYTGYFSQIRIRILEKIVSLLSGEEIKISFNLFGDFSEWLSKPDGNRKFWLKNNISVKRVEQSVIFSREKTYSGKIKIRAEINPGEVYRNEELGIMVRADWEEQAPPRFPGTNLIEYLDARKLVFPLILRNWRPGDRFQPLGLAQQKKMSDFLTDEEDLFLPKKHMLVLESAGEIAWVVGARINENYKLTGLSEKILKLEATKI